MKAFIRFLQWAVRNHPRKIVLFHVLLIGLSAYGVATRLKIDTSVDGLMSSDDPDVVLNHALKSEFVNDEATLIAFDLGHAFTRDDLRHLERVIRRMEALPAVTRVESLIDVEDVRSDGAGGLDASPLIGSERLAELSDDDVASLRTYIAAHPLYPGNLVSRDNTVLAALISFVPPDVGKANIRAVTLQIEDIVAEESAGWAPAWVAGYPVVEHEADELVKSDVLLLSPIVLFVMLVIFYAFTRRLFSVVLLCALALWTISMTLGFLVFTDTPINVVTSAVPAVVLTTSAVYGIYILGLLQTLEHDDEPAISIIEAATRPSFLSMISTGVGFLSMLFIHVDALQEMGLGLALGIFSAFVATLLLLPALIKIADFRPLPLKWRTLDRAAQMGVTLARRPWRVIGASVLLVGLAVPGLAQLYIETDPLDYFHPDSKTIQAHDFARDHLGGAGIVNLVIRTDTPGDALRPDVMQLAEALTQEAARHDMVDHTFSLLDYNALMDKALRPESPPQRVLQSKELAAQYLMLYEMGGDASDLAPYINHDRSALLLRMRIRYLKASVVLALEEKLERVAADHPEVKADVRLLGSAFLISKSAQSISHGLFPGFIAAILVVLLTFWLTLRSWKLALIAIPPNVLPYLFCMAVLGYSGIPISIGTSLVGFVAIGLAVDDTAHIMAHLQHSRSLRQLYREVGAPVTMTSVAVGLGFLVLLTSSFQVIAVFGIATSITLATAWVADVVLLPSILTVCGLAPSEDEHGPSADKGSADTAKTNAMDAAAITPRGD